MCYLPHSHDLFLNYGIFYKDIFIFFLVRKEKQGKLIFFRITGIESYTRLECNDSLRVYIEFNELKSNSRSTLKIHATLLLCGNLQPYLEILCDQVKGHCTGESPNKPVINIPGNTDILLSVSETKKNPAFLKINL